MDSLIKLVVIQQLIDHKTGKRGSAAVSSSSRASWTSASARRGSLPYKSVSPPRRCSIPALAMNRVQTRSLSASRQREAEDASTNSEASVASTPPLTTKTKRRWKLNFSDRKPSDPLSGVMHQNKRFSIFGIGKGRKERCGSDPQTPMSVENSSEGDGNPKKIPGNAIAKAEHSGTFFASAAQMILPTFVGQKQLQSVQQDDVGLKVKGKNSDPSRLSGTTAFMRHPSLKVKAHSIHNHPHDSADYKEPADLNIPKSPQRPIHLNIQAAESQMNGSQIRRLSGPQTTLGSPRQTAGSPKRLSIEGGEQRRSSNSSTGSARRSPRNNPPIMPDEGNYHRSPSPVSSAKPTSSRRRRTRRPSSKAATSGSGKARNRNAAGSSSSSSTENESSNRGGIRSSSNCTPRKLSAAEYYSSDAASKPKRSLERSPAKEVAAAGVTRLAPQTVQTVPSGGLAGNLTSDSVRNSKCRSVSQRNSPTAKSKSHLQNPTDELLADVASSAKLKRRSIECGSCVTTSDRTHENNVGKPAVSKTTKKVRSVGTQSFLSQINYRFPFFDTENDI